MTGISNIQEVLAQCGVDDDTLCREQKDSLDDLGYCVFPPDASIWDHFGASRDEICHIVDDLVAQEEWRGGMEGKEEYVSPKRAMQPGARRLGNLVEKHPCFGRLVLWPKLLAAAYHVIRGELKVSVVNFREPLLGDGGQELHIDWLPRETQEDPFEAAIGFLFLDDSKKESGAIRVVPGSHKILGWPEEHIDVFAGCKDEVAVEVEAGSLVFVNQLTWHGGGTNESGAHRRMLTANYRHRKYKQLLNQKMYLSDRTKRSLDPVQQYLLAVRDQDPTQEEKSVGAGAYRRAKFGLLEGETEVAAPPPVTIE